METQGGTVTDPKAQLNLRTNRHKPRAGVGGAGTLLARSRFKAEAGFHFPGR